MSKNKLTEFDRLTTCTLLLERYFDKDFAHSIAEELSHRDFFKAPASTKYHGAYEGGLFDHSYRVACNLIHLTDKLPIYWGRRESPCIIGLLHDLCKADQYRHPNSGGLIDTDRWEYNPDTLLKGHGDKSVMLASSLMTLTEEEIMCIRYHMGAFTDKEEWRDYTNAIHVYPNVLWTHTADMMAAHIDIV